MHSQSRLFLTVELTSKGGPHGQDCSVIGHGTIGRHIVEKAPEYEHEVVFVVTRKGVATNEGEIVAPFSPSATSLHNAQIVNRLCLDRKVTHALIAIPSGGDGSVEAAYITTLVRHDIKIVTAGKSALANQFAAVGQYLRMIGYDATVGGGTMVPSFLREHLYVNEKHPFVFTGVLNGTLNYAQTRVRDGASPEQICNEAVRLGFAEPPHFGTRLTPHDMYCGEFEDISRKIAIIFNTQLFPMTKRVVSQTDFSVSVFDTWDLKRVVAGNSTYRYLVRICSRDEDLDFFAEIDLGGAIRERIGGVSVAAGFVRLEGALLKWVPDHVGNACQLMQNGDTDIKVGQGAGPVATVGAMFSNLRRFIEE
jgi:hypothetical protein